MKLQSCYVSLEQTYFNRCQYRRIPKVMPPAPHPPPESNGYPKVTLIFCPPNPKRNGPRPSEINGILPQNGNKTLMTVVFNVHLKDYFPSA